MTEKIYDSSVLDEKNGTFNMSVEIPPTLHPELNRDGNPPRVSLCIKTPGTLRHSFNVLEDLRLDLDKQAHACIGFALEFAPDALTAGLDDHSAEKFDALMMFVRDEWAEPVEIAEAILVEGSTGKSFPMSISVIAPSGGALGLGLKRMLSLPTLGALLDSFMPEHDDEWIKHTDVRPTAPEDIEVITLGEDFGQWVVVGTSDAHSAEEAVRQHIIDACGETIEEYTGLPAEFGFIYRNDWAWRKVEGADYDEMLVHGEAGNDLPRFAGFMVTL